MFIYLDIYIYIYRYRNNDRENSNYEIVFKIAQQLYILEIIVIRDYFEEIILLFL